MAHHGTLPQISCCLCGAPMTANGVNMCQGCLAEKYKITECLDQFSPDILMCKRCGKWRTKNPGYTRGEVWQHAELESGELLGIAMRQGGVVRTMEKGGLVFVDARWEWTEPHSRRLRVRVTVRKHLAELPNGGVTLQASTSLEFKVNTRQCGDCAAENSTGNGEPWRAVVQLRQHVEHKRTLMWLEQQARSAGTASKALMVSQVKDGLDFFFTDQSTASKLIEWMKAKVPLRARHTSKLVSQDFNSNVNHMKHTTVLEVLPLCRDDLIVVPKKSMLRSKLPGIHLVVKVSSVLHLIQVHPPTYRPVELTADQYYRAPFEAVLRASDLTAFTLLSAEGLEESDNEQDLQGIPEMEEAGSENQEGDDDDDDDDDDREQEGEEGVTEMQHEESTNWGPDNLVEGESELLADASPQDEMVEPAKDREQAADAAAGAGAAAAGAGGGEEESHHQHVLEGLERLSGLGAPGTIGNLSSATLRVTKKQQKWEAASSVASSSWSILNGSDGTEVEVVKDLGLSQPISVRTHLPPHRLGKPGGEIMGYDLDTRVLPDDILEALDGQCPSCVLVRSARPIKVFKARRKGVTGGRTRAALRLERSATRAEGRRTAAALGLTPTEAADEALAQADAAAAAEDAAAEDAAEDGDKGEVGGVGGDGANTASDEAGPLRAAEADEGRGDAKGSLGSQPRLSAKERRKQKRDAIGKKK